MPNVGFAAPKLQQFHIDAGDAALTLNEFGRQSTLQIAFDYNMVHGRRTRAISGEFEAPVALKQMLVGTGLVFDYVNEKTLAVTLESHEDGAGTAVATGPTAAPAPHSNTAETQSVGHDGPGTGDPYADTRVPELEEVHVTGTNLRGEPPVGEHVIILDRLDIEESGAGTVQDFLRTLPQTFGGGATEDTHIGSEAATNSGLGSGINLRGLGARSTLVLINGKRMAPGGTEAQFVDVESIPLAAVERVDTLPDSASALYGADAVGGVVNFVMRDNFTGTETQLRTGSGTQNTLGEYQAAQTVGRKWDSGNGMLSLEFYQRDALPSYARRYATSDLVPLGGGNFNTIGSNPGNIIIGSTIYPIPPGQNGTQLTAANLVAGPPNLQDKFEDADLLPRQQRYSLYGSLKQDLIENVNLFGNVLVSHRDAKELTGGLAEQLLVPGSNPFNPTGGRAPVLVDYNFLDDLGSQSTDVQINTANVTLGVDIDVGASWRVNLYGNYAREKESQLTTAQVDFPALTAALADPDPATAFNPFGAGSYTNPVTLKSISSSSRFYTDSRLTSQDITADGPIARLPGGAVKLAVGADRREQFFSSLIPASATSPVAQSNRSRDIVAAFGELTVPLFGKDNGGSGYRRLELSIAGRYEHYSDFGQAATPKFGLAWAPVDGLAFRGTWGRSIRAPTLADLDESHNVAIQFNLPDASSPTGITSALIRGGKNADLTVEHGRSWTAGLDFKLDDRVPGLAASLTYFNILFNDRIQGQSLTANILGDPTLADLVTRNPSAALLSQICSHTAFPQGTTATCDSATIGAVVDLRLQNVAMLDTQGIDFTTTFERRTPYGKVKLGLDGTYLFKFNQAEGPDSPVSQLLDTQNNPINLRLRGTLGWQGSRFGASTAANFQNRYEDVVSQPNRNIRSFTTIDAQVRYDVSPYGQSWLQNTRIELNAINVFNVSPPFLNNQVVGIGYDEENADPTGRLLSIQIRKAW